MKVLKPLLLSFSLLMITIAPALAESSPKHKLISVGSLEGGIGYGTDSGSLGSYPGYQFHVGGNLNNNFQLGGDFAGNWTNKYGYLSIFGLDARYFPVGSNGFVNPFVSLDAGGVFGSSKDLQAMPLAPWIGGKLGAEFVVLPLYVTPNKKMIVYSGLTAFVGYSTLSEWQLGLSLAFKPILVK